MYGLENLGTGFVFVGVWSRVGGLVEGWGWVFHGEFEWRVCAICVRAGGLGLCCSRCYKTFGLSSVLLIFFLHCAHMNYTYVELFNLL